MVPQTIVALAIITLVWLVNVWVVTTDAISATTHTHAEVLPLQNSVCFTRFSGSVPERKGQITGGTSFARALTQLASQPDVSRIIEIGTWYGGGSTEAFVDGLKKNPKIRKGRTLPVVLQSRSKDYGKEHSSP